MTTPSFFRSRVTTVKVSQSDIRTIAASELMELKKDIKKSIKRTSNKMSKIHLEAALNKLNKILNGKSFSVVRQHFDNSFRSHIIILYQYQ